MYRKKYPSIYKYLQLSKHPNISAANKSALRGLWADIWHNIGIEWPKNHLPGSKFSNSIFHADSSALEIICKVAADCGVKLIRRLEDDEIELIAPGAENYSIIISKDRYENSFGHDYSYLDSMSVPEAINVLKDILAMENVAFDYISLRFKTPSEFTGLRHKILIYSPQSDEFRSFMISAKQKLEATAEILLGAVDVAQEPVKTNALAERAAISRNLQERCVMMRKRHAFLKAIAAPFNSLDEFAKANNEWCAIVGLTLDKRDNYIEININLNNGDDETYFILSNDGCLTVSEIVRWQDDYCATSFLNIFTLENADEDEITTMINCSDKR